MLLNAGSNGGNRKSTLSGTPINGDKKLPPDNGSLYV